MEAHMALHAQPTSQAVDAAATVEFNEAIASALDVVGPTIAKYQEVTARLGRVKPGTHAHDADTAYARDLMDQIDRAARRIEMEDGRELTGDALIELAIANRRARNRLPANPTRATMRTLHESLMKAMARTTTALHELNAAETELRDAKRAERAAREAYEAQAAGPLVLQ
jgi:hypothetical protein